MPIYEYECDKCGEKIEVVQYVNEPPLEKCKSCGGKLKKLISHSKFILKGSCWANDGYTK